MATKEEQVERINNLFSAKIEEIQKRRNYRMENYYNCVDDYSFGGLCDKADNELENRLRLERDIMIEQVMNGGKVIRESSFYRLISDTDKCDGAQCGRYGEFFTIDGKFIGVPKKMSTLTKKGYKLFHIARTYECTLKEVNEYGAQWQSMKIANEIITEVQYAPEFIGRLSYIDYQYETYFNQKK